jgi:hypothetical protein
MRQDPTNSADSILCGDHAIKQIDKPFITGADVDEWAL